MSNPHEHGIAIDVVEGGEIKHIEIPRPKKFQWVATCKSYRKSLTFQAIGYMEVSPTVIRELDLNPDYELAEWFEAVYDKVLDMFETEYEVSSIIVSEVVEKG